jgi:hypothetical protein
MFYRALVTLQFLKQQTSAWKLNHVACWISASGTFGGTVTKIKAVVSGDSSGQPLNATMFRDALQTFQSSLILQPTPAVYGANSTVATIGATTYAFSQIGQLLLDLGLTSQSAVYQAYLSAKSNLTPPGIPLHCFQGSNVIQMPSLSYLTWRLGDNPNFIQLRQRIRHKPSNSFRRWRWNSELD